MGGSSIPDEYKQYLRHSEYPFRDAIYNMLVKAHARRGKPWTTEGFFSDRMFWNFGLDQIWPWVPVLIFIWLVYFLATWTYNRYGLFRAVVVLAVMCILRLNAVVRAVNYTNRLIKEKP